MKKIQSIISSFSAAVQSIIVACCLIGCTPHVPSPESIFYSEQDIDQITEDGTIYHINDFVDKYMTEEGNYLNDSIHRYRNRATGGLLPAGVYLFSIDTLPSGGEGIYIRARVETDDQGGNFYKTLVLQEVLDNGEQQNIRIGIDAASISGLYPRGQELIIRCNGLAIGRYANQVQLCTPAYNNEIYKNLASDKIGWAPGRIDIATFKRCAYRIGYPDASKLQIDDISITDFFSHLDIVANREMDGRLVRLNGVHFTGELDDDGTIKNCSFANPDTATDANVFAPTTKNMGYPQSRIIADLNGNHTLVSVSEYAKQARYYLPGAGSAYDGEYQYTISIGDTVMPSGTTTYLQPTINGKIYYIPVPPERVSYRFHTDDVIFFSDAEKESEKSYVYDGTEWVNKVGILHCPEYEGSVTGVLSFYVDNAKKKVTGLKWSISVCDMSDIKMKKADGTSWTPVEYTNKNK